MKKSLFILLLSFLSISTGFAAEEAEEVPVWFPLLEVGGVIIGIFVCIVISKVYFGMQGGAIGTGFAKILIGVVSITLGVAINGLNETLELFSEFTAEVLLESLIYLGLIFIGFGSQNIAKIA